MLFSLLVTSLLLQVSQGAGPNIFMQYLMPSYSATATYTQPSPSPPQAQAQQSQAQQVATSSTFSQILMGLLSYKLQWLNQLAAQFISSPQHQIRPPGYPWMTTVVTTLSGNSPSVPGITIAGAPINHYPPYPGAPGFVPPPLPSVKPTTPQDDHWAAPPPTTSVKPPNSTVAPNTTTAPQYATLPENDEIDFESPIQSPVLIVTNNVTVASNTTGS